MPLLIPIVLLFAVIGVYLLLWAVGLLRRPFIAPVARPVAAWQLSLRGTLVLVSLVPYVGMTAWLRPSSLRDVGIGLGVGLVLGAVGAALARVDVTSAGVVQRPNRMFVAGIALIVLARAAWSMVGAAHFSMTPDPRLAGLGAVLLGYALAHAWVLRSRVVAVLRACKAGRQTAP